MFHVESSYFTLLNFASFPFKIKDMITAKLIAKKDLTEDVFELKFETSSNFEYLAGQFITIKITDQETPCFRAYSLSSAPQENKFELLIKLMENGRGSNWLHNLKLNDQIKFLGPNGKFLFNENSQKDLLFIATGTGLAPLKTMIEDQLKKGNTHKITLLHGVRYIKGLFYQDFFENLATTHENFDYQSTISQPEQKSYTGNTGRVTAFLEKTTLDSNNTEVYLCGLNAMIESTKKILIDKGINEDSIHFEKYD
jgi:CDP-4-dehydro-6-deoxyglucose reductase, E3